MDFLHNFLEFETKTGLIGTKLVLGDNMKVVGMDVSFLMSLV